MNIVIPVKFGTLIDFGLGREIDVSEAKFVSLLHVSERRINRLNVVVSNFIM